MLILLLVYIEIEMAVLGAGLAVGFDTALNRDTGLTLIFGLVGALIGLALGASLVYLAQRGLRDNLAPLPMFAFSFVTGWATGNFVYWRSAGTEGDDARLVIAAALLGTLPGAAIGLGLGWLYAKPRQKPVRSIVTPAGVAGTPLATVQAMSQQIGDIIKAYPYAKGEIAPLNGSFVATITLNNLRFYVVCPPAYPRKAPAQANVERVDEATGDAQELPLAEKRLLKRWTGDRTLLTVVNTGLEMVRNGPYL